MSVRDIIFSASGAAGESTYVEDVFSTYLYTGNGFTQTINNGIFLGDQLGAGGSIVSAGSGRLNFSNFSISGQFTVEAFVFNSGSNNPMIAAAGNGTTAINNQLLRILSGFQHYNNQTNSASISITGSVPVPTNQWVHLAITRDASNTVRIFTNGILAGSATDANTLNFNQISGIFYNNNHLELLTGRISNLRYVSGSALYTTNFTPPSAPLTAISGTQLLTCQAPNPLVDNSGNNVPLTVTSLTTSTDGPFVTEQGKGGMVWIKQRSGTLSHVLTDSARGVDKAVFSNLNIAQQTGMTYITSFNSNGFSVANLNATNQDTVNLASWTFRKAEKFFDVVTYTGDGTSSRDIAHSLGSAPGMIIVKGTSAASNWCVWHRSADDNILFLELANAAVASTGFYFGNATTQTSSSFRVLSAGAGTNVNGRTYVAYLFAHNAGGFGAAGTDNIISCGSFTTDGSGNATVNLGYEPQWILYKRTNAAEGWWLQDNMRGWPAVGNDSGAFLQANTSSAEGSAGLTYPNATGFQITGGLGANNTFIYMAIRRPMKVPTTGTEVFATQATRGATNGTPSQNAYTANFPVDLLWQGARAGASSNVATYDRLRGTTQVLNTSSTNAEGTGAAFRVDDMDGVYTTSSLAASSSFCGWMFRRAPGFFDVVCYSGTSVSGAGPAQNVTHNLGVVPELIIIKSRSNARSWQVYSATEGNAKRNELVDTAFTSTDYWDSTTPTATTFRVNKDNDVNGSGFTYVAYLFATVAGVSKVGSYTGTGSTQTINAGLPTGARFVLIKRTNSTGNWWVWDTARGMVTSTDPRLAFNTIDAEINNDWVLTTTGGFQIVTSDATVNANGGSYIYLAIA